MLFGDSLMSVASSAFCLFKMLLVLVVGVFDAFCLFNAYFGNTLMFWRLKQNLQIGFRLRHCESEFLVAHVHT